MYTGNDVALQSTTKKDGLDISRRLGDSTRDLSYDLCSSPLKTQMQLLEPEQNMAKVLSGTLLMYSDKKQGRS